MGMTTFVRVFLVLGWGGWALAQPGPRPGAAALVRKPASLSLQAGPTLLAGDLKDRRSDWMAGVQLTVPFTAAFGAALSVNGGQLRAEQEAFYRSRSECRFGQVAALALLDVLQIRRNPDRLAECQLYGGLGLVYFRAFAYDLATQRLQRLTNNENSRRTRDGVRTRGQPGSRYTRELTLPVGVRISSPLSRQVSVFGDVQYTFVRTDKLDATLDNNNRTLADGAAQTEQALYHNNSRDAFVALSVGVLYYFGSR